MNVDQHIRARIRTEMSRQKITQAQLARTLDIKPPSLAQILSGKRGIVPSSLMDVLGALGLTLRALPEEPGDKD